MTAISLPQTNAHGFYEIRMESVGGLGANVAGKIIGEAGVLRMGLGGANFASYGAEKKGTPVKSFVRFCAPDRDIRTTSPVEFPHLLAILHESLIRAGIAAEGITHDTTVVVNSLHPAEEIRQALGMCGGALGTIDASGIATAENSRANMVMLGAMTQASAFIDPEAIKAVISATLGHKYPQLLEGNLRAFDRGFAELELHQLVCTLEHEPPAPHRAASPLGYENAPMGGTIINPGNTVLKDLSPTRMGRIPIYDRSLCINCGKCEYTCPDFCYTFAGGIDHKNRRGQVLVGIDYRYCKGCLRCVEACPTEALTTGDDEEEYVAEHGFSQLGASPPKKDGET
ncbi:pyruvate synthase subunit PorC [bacterium BMS3Abin01]|nr:pyruvate synthase subunit PorC [bacterium BMS3Abin01]